MTMIIMSHQLHQNDAVVHVSSYLFSICNTGSSAAAESLTISDLCMRRRSSYSALYLNKNTTATRRLHSFDPFQTASSYLCRSGRKQWHAYPGYRVWVPSLCDLNRLGTFNFRFRPSQTFNVRLTSSWRRNILRDSFSAKKSLYIVVVVTSSK